MNKRGAADLDAPRGQDQDEQPVVKLENDDDDDGANVFKQIVVPLAKRFKQFIDSPDAAACLDALSAVFEACASHEVPDCKAEIGALFSAVRTAAAAEAAASREFEVDPRPAAVVACLRKVSLRKPLHAYGVSIAVQEAWPDANWGQIYEAIHAASSHGGAWAPLDCAALSLSDLYVFALVVAARTSTSRSTWRRFERNVDNNNNNNNNHNNNNHNNKLAFSVLRPKEGSCWSMPIAHMGTFLDNAAATHAWSVLHDTPLSPDVDMSDIFRVALGAGGGAGEATASALAIGQELRKSLATVPVARLVAGFYKSYLGNVLPMDALACLLWPDFARFIVMVQDRRFCQLSFVQAPTQTVPWGCEHAIACKSFKVSDAVLPVMNAMFLEDLDEGLRAEAAAAAAQITLKEGLELDPELFKTWCATAQEPFADGTLRKAFELLEHDTQIELDREETFNVHTFHVHTFEAMGKTWRMPVLCGTVDRRSAAFRERLLLFLEAHRPGVLPRAPE